MAKRPRHRRDLIVSASFQSYLDSIPGLGGWGIQDQSPSTTALARFGGSYDSSYDGAHFGVKLGEPGAGNIQYTGEDDGINDYTQLFSAALATFWNNTEGELVSFINVRDASVLIDGTVRSWFTFITNTADFIDMTKYSANNQARVRVVTSGNAVNQIFPFTYTALANINMCWKYDGSTNTDYEIFVNAVSVSTFSSTGPFTGAVTTALSGAVNTGGGQSWNGNRAYMYIANRQLTSDERTGIYNRSGIANG